MAFEGARERFGMLSELWAFMKVRKKWWLGPIVLMLALLGLLVVFTQGTAVAPFIYTLFLSPGWDASRGDRRGGLVAPLSAFLCRPPSSRPSAPPRSFPRGRRAARSSP